VFRLGFPPHLFGLADHPEVWQSVLAELQDWLHPFVGDVDVTLSSSYEVAGRNLRSGALDAAWVPPLVGAQAQEEGAHVVARVVRDGQAEVRGALVVHESSLARAQADASFFDDGGVFGDAASLTGFVLPMAHLAKQGVVVDVDEDAFVGLQEALHRVERRRARFTGMFAVGEVGDGVEGFASLRVCAVTEGAPADAIVLGKESLGLRSQVEAALQVVPEGLAVLGMEGLAPATDAEHGRLLGLV